MTPSHQRAFPGPQVPVAAAALKDLAQVGAAPSSPPAASVSEHRVSNEGRLRPPQLRPLCPGSRTLLLGPISDSRCGGVWKDVVEGGGTGVCKGWGRREGDTDRAFGNSGVIGV